MSFYCRSSICFLPGLKSYAGKGLGPVFINTVPTASVPAAGLIDTHHPAGVAHAVQTINGRLAEIARNHGQIVLIDTNRALAGLPARAWVDPKLWYYGRLPFSAIATRHLASAFAGRLSRAEERNGQGACA